MGKLRKRPASSRAQLAAILATFTATAIVVAVSIRDLGMTLQWTLVAVALVWLIYFGWLAYSKRKDSRGTCQRCMKVLPESFLESVEGAGDDGGAFSVGGPRSPLVACRHCLYAEDYPK